MKSCEKRNFIYEVVDNEKFERFLQKISNKEIIDAIFAEGENIDERTVYYWKAGKHVPRSRYLEIIINSQKISNFDEIGVNKRNLDIDKECKEVFKTNLKTLLSKNEMEQTEFAKLIKVSKSTVNKWCNGIQFPSLCQLIEIATSFKVSFDYLLMNTREDVKYEDLELNVDTVDKLRKYQNERAVLFESSSKSIEDITEMDIVNFIIAHTDFFTHFLMEIRNYIESEVKENLDYNLSKTIEDYKKYCEKKCSSIKIESDKNIVLEMQEEMKEQNEKLENIKNEFYNNIKIGIIKIMNEQKTKDYIIDDIFVKVANNIPEILKNKTIQNKKIIIKL